MARIGRDLLAQARILARHEPKRPKQATLRRSVSTSYYALFHFLIEEATAILCGSAHADEQLRHLAGRAFVHGKMKTLCKEFVKPNVHDVHEVLRPFWATLPIANNPQMRIVAQTFIDLQQERHTADYDLSVTLSRQDALNAVTRTESAIQSWEQLKAANRPVCRLFALALILWPSLGSRL
jgi:hypothetical protein